MRLDIWMNKEISIYLTIHTYSIHICYLLFRPNSFRNRNIRLMVFAFKVYVLPLLDYCSTIWCPYKLNDIDKIEAVQRVIH